MGIAFGTAATVFRKSHINDYAATYIHVKNEDIIRDEPRVFPVPGNRFAQVCSERFLLVPGMQIAYWLTDRVMKLFAAVSLGSVCSSREGVTSGSNEIFLRLWHEVNNQKIGWKCKSQEACINSGAKWFPHNKGGDYRKWYGNKEYIINWENNGSQIRSFADSITGRIRSHNYNLEYNFREYLTWTNLSSGKFSLRYSSPGAVFDTTSSALFSNHHVYYILALLNSKVGELFLDILCPTFKFQPGNIIKVPYLLQNVRAVESLSASMVEISRKDWDSFEISWDFQTHPLVRCASFSRAEMIEDAKHHIRDMNFIKEAFVNWSNECYLRFEQLKANEEKLNRMFIDIYGLQDELTPEVDDKDVTVRKADLQREIRSFISYAVGCMFGRYSLDMPGLAFAGGNFSDRFINAGNPLTDENGDLLVDENGDYLSDGENCYSVIQVDGKEKRTTFAPDYDNILPICDDEYFEDDIVRRFVEFVEAVYGKDTLEENLKYIADALGGKGSPREVIRNYFLNDFYADHLKVYQKRPIYWLFDSGKKNGFKCLIYMHRYQPDTIARIRTDYVHELQSRYRTAIDELERRISDAATAERVKLNKQLAKLQAQADELRDYEEMIHHLADQMISIDLDDGVKVNYAKFQDVLAKIK